jgi:hypothetical protein
VVCFGKAFWPDFERLLNLDARLARLGPSESWRYFDERRVVLAPFFGWWHMNGQKAEEIAAKLHEWNVQLGY